MPARPWWRTAAWQPGCGACGPPFVWDRTQRRRRSRCWDDSRLRVFHPPHRSTPPEARNSLDAGRSPGSRVIARSRLLVPCGNNGNLEPASPLQLRGQPRIDRGCWPGVAFPFQPLRATCVWTKSSALTPIRKTNGMMHPLLRSAHDNPPTQCYGRSDLSTLWYGRDDLSTQCYGRYHLSTPCYGRDDRSTPCYGRYHLSTSWPAKAGHPRLASVVADTLHARHSTTMTSRNLLRPLAA